MDDLADLATVRDAYLLPYQGCTRDVYVYQLRRWIEWCNTNSIEPLRVRRNDVEVYIQHLLVDLGQKASSVNSALTPVRGFYRFAYHEGIIDRDPAVLARRPRYPRGPVDTLGLDRDQMRSFLSAGERLGGRYHAVAYLTACMALRATETCSINVEDYQRVVRGHRVIEFVGKGGVPARMPLPVPVLRALEIAADGRSSGPLILRQDGGPLSRQGLATLVGTIGKRAGVPYRVRPHLLRHSCITNALEAGANLRKVQDLARHGDPRTTMMYDRNRTNLDDHAVHALVAFLSPEQPIDDDPSPSLQAEVTDDLVTDGR